MRETLPLEERIEMFRTMLVEKEVSPLSTFQKELAKIVFDSRYLLLTSKERRQVFDDFCSDKIEEERKLKREKEKKHRDDFRAMLQEANLSAKSQSADLHDRFGRDPRYRAIERSRDRLALFDEYMSILRRQEREEKIAQREKAKSEFQNLLSEHTEILIKVNSTWNDFKETIRNDPRYRALDSSSTREELFRKFIRSLPFDNHDDKRSDARLIERAKKEKVEASLREREREVARDLATHMIEREKGRDQLKKTEVLDVFQAMLIDLVRNPDYSWHDAKKIMKKDSRWDLIEDLPRDIRQELFTDYRNKLHTKRKDKFHELLHETKEIKLDSEWKDIRRIIKDDPRFIKFSSSERKCEREFKDFLRNRINTAKSNFKDLLKETKIIDSDTRRKIEESESQHLMEIIGTLQNDKRYVELEPLSDERRKVLLNYFEELAVTGPTKDI